MLQRITAFAFVFGLSSIVYASPPHTTTRDASRAAPARARTSPKAKPKPPRVSTPAAGHDHAGHDDRFRNVRLKLRKAQTNTGGRVQVYVNGSGATLQGGFEDASRGHSSIVEFSGFSSVTIPAYAGGSWGQVMSCVRDQFTSFDIEVTDQRPSSDDFIMVMVGGSPSLIGEGSSVAGVAPYMGSVIRGSVGFAFSQVHGGDVQGLCETVAHEIGHTLGLDHAYECSDTMSYLSCGPKEFQNQSMSCGEWEPRTCGGGSSQQNSHGHLMSSLGAAPASDPASDPAPVPQTPDAGPAPRPPTPEPSPEPADDPSSDEWWDNAGSDEWEEWIVWDPYSEQWLSWDANSNQWIVWADEDDGDWYYEDEGDWYDDDYGCPNG